MSGGIRRDAMVQWMSHKCNQFIVIGRICVKKVRLNMRTKSNNIITRNVVRWKSQPNKIA